AMPPANVNVVLAKQMLLSPSGWVSGLIVSPNNSEIASEVSGRIIELAELGATVTKGEIIARIDDSRLQLRLAEARSVVVSEKARYNFLESEVKRVQALAKRNLSAKTDLDRLASERDVARSEYLQSQSRVEQILLDIAFSKLKAPFDGLVSQRLSNVGEFVQSGTGIIQLVETNNNEVSVSAPITSYPYLKQGMSLAIESPMGNAMAPVISLIPVAENRSHLMEIRLDASNINWPVGLKVKVAVPNDPSKDVVAIPRDGLVLRREGISVFKVGSDNTAEQVSIRVGIGAGEFVEVIGPITSGDQIIVRGAERIQPGQMVNIIESNDRLISGKK
ncbi:MAG: efflux RND transporter periplasmic adaptor subunit, partial [Gammaproteobacteria bacterium]|nr:efflux RND transporter periplasmic adaptor subunit [Gammaproteobacteria bacterium]